LYADINIDGTVSYHYHDSKFHVFDANL